MRLPRSVVLLPLCAISAAAGTPTDLIAHYRFETNGNDCLGRGTAFLLTNQKPILGVPAVFTNASVYYGYASNLKIFSRALTAADLLDLFSASQKERPAFPRQSFPWLMILFGIAIGFVILLLLRRQLKLGRLRRSRASPSIEDPIST